jgi:hypothetical protein
MFVGPDNYFHLTYCTNIHPGNGWREVAANLQRYVPALRAHLAPEKAFGIGLRLSSKESHELLQDRVLEQFQAFLQENKLYVFTLNGFPYGTFHGQPVKAAVHLPDWLDEERIAYTLRLIEILTVLLPDGMEGSISTSPLTYKVWFQTQEPELWRCLTENIVRIAQALVRVKREQGKLIHLDIEPEPDGLLERSEEVVRFYTRWLLVEGACRLGRALAISQQQAREHLLEHIRICLDTCHIAVEYEEPSTVLTRFEEVGIKVGKVQLSSALKVAFPADKRIREQIGQALEPFAESTYLHQVVQQNHDGTYLHYVDLPDALHCIHDSNSAQWRVHFHVPIFIDSFPAFSSTQDTLLETLYLLNQRRFCNQLEIETYTWNVLPGQLRMNLRDSLIREYTWVLSNIEALARD